MIYRLELNIEKITLNILMHLSRNEPEARPIVSFKEKRNKEFLCHLGQFLHQF